MSIEIIENNTRRIIGVTVIGVTAGIILKIVLQRLRNSSQTLQVTTYNALSPTYAGINGGEWYQHINPNLMLWKNRQIALIERIQSFDSDLLCLQEINSEFFAELQTQLPGYTGVFLSKMGKPGEAIFFRNHLRLIDTFPVVAADGRWAQMAQFQWGNQTLKVFNGHLSWDEQGVKALAQMQDFIEQMDGKTVDHCIICGDFNVPRDSGAIQYLEKLGFQRAYQGVEPAVTCSVPDAAHEVDFIFTTPHLKPVWIQPVKPIAGPGMLPAVGEPSDHLPKTAVFLAR